MVVHVSKRVIHVYFAVNIHLLGEWDFLAKYRMSEALVSEKEKSLSWLCHWEVKHGNKLISFKLFPLTKCERLRC